MRNRKTTKKTQKRKKQPSRAIRERVSIPFKYGVLTVICGAFLVAGFFGAARQHFASIDYGIKNSKLRKQVKDLEAEKQRLILEREVAYSPEKITKAAKKIGMIETSNRVQTTFSAVNISADETEVAELKDESKKKEDEKEKTEKPETKSKDKKDSEKTAKDSKKKSTNKKSDSKDSKKLKPKVQEAKDSTTTRSRKVKAKK